MESLQIIEVILLLFVIVAAYLGCKQDIQELSPFRVKIKKKIEKKQEN